MHPIHTNIHCAAYLVLFVVQPCKNTVVVAVYTERCMAGVCALGQDTASIRALS
jgi:hypothetical protein